MGVVIPASYKMNGEITLGGNLVLTASSPQYGEKIWKKSIALDKATFTYNGSLKWRELPSVADGINDNSPLGDFKDKALATDDYTYDVR